MRNLAFALLVFVTACQGEAWTHENGAGTPSSSTPAAGSVTGLITPTSDGGYSASFSNGLHCANPEQFKTAMQIMCSKAHLVSELSFEDPIEEVESKSGEKRGPLKLTVFGYRYDIRHIKEHENFIGGCIKRTLKHRSFVCNRRPTAGGKSELVFDLHTAKWKESGQVCYAYYLSPEDRFGSLGCKVKCFNDDTPNHDVIPELESEFSAGLEAGLVASGELTPEAAAITGGTLSIWILILMLVPS